MPRFTAVVVGAGLAGLSAAYSLARDKIDVLVVDRGDYPGAKNVTGGRMYLQPIKDLYPELWEIAPWERHVVKEGITMLGRQAAVSLELTSQTFAAPPYHSHTVLASRFNRWFAQKASEKGARIIPKYKVDDLVMEGGRVRGIVVAGSRIEANVVVVADGSLSLLAQKASLVGKRQPADLALGVKEVVALSKQAIEDRFSLGPGEGAARLFVGAVADGLMGGGFVYTNSDSLSVGLVVSIQGLAGRPDLTPYGLLDRFKARPEVAALLRGGESVEYSAHTLSESGIKGMGRLFGDGVLVAGDAAGMLLNTGITVRGMEFAIASGALAARAVGLAKQRQDFSAGSLSAYDKLVKESFIWKDLSTFKDAPSVLGNPRLYDCYPQLACDVLEEAMTIGDGPKGRLASGAFRRIRQAGAFKLLKDAIALRRI